MKQRSKLHGQEIGHVSFICHGHPQEGSKPRDSDNCMVLFIIKFLNSINNGKYIKYRKWVVDTFRTIYK